MVSEYSQRLIDLEAQLAIAAPDRIVTRLYQPRGHHHDKDLKTGIFTIVSRGVLGYTNTVGRMASYGRHQVLITGQLMLPPSDGNEANGQQVEDAEFTMLEQLRTLARSPLPESIGGLALLEFGQSGQLEAPYGWIAARFEIGP